MTTENSRALFSVVVPVYNASSYLEECIESVLHQTCPDYEVILVDDGSTDRSGALCDRYASDTVTVFHQENQGHTAARQKGAELAKGDYVVFLDSDDLLDPLFLERVRQTLDKAPADMVQCRRLSFFDLRHPNGLQVWDNPVPDGYYDVERIQQTVYPCLMMDQSGRCFPRAISAKAIRREIVLKHLPRVPAVIKTGEDMCGVISMFADIRTLSVISDAVYLYRIVPGSISRSPDPEALVRCASTVGFLKQCLPIAETVLYPQYLRLCIQQAYSACVQVLRSGERKKIRAAYDCFSRQTGFCEILRQAQFTDRRLRMKKELLQREWFWAIRFLNRSH
ncbi:MAG: glycosyltransferase family 2 protein [Oscillospiraceae bacterium]|nr:glycosyltransferase family 2 protein [Oscillospiraceae bacterium]